MMSKDFNTFMRVYHFEPYEGESEVFSGTVEEIRNWIKTTRSFSRDEIQDMSIYIDGPDMEEVLKSVS